MSRMISTRINSSQSILLNLSQYKAFKKYIKNDKKHTYANSDSTNMVQ